jgi:hypothetical protein
MRRHGALLSSMAGVVVVAVVVGVNLWSAWHAAPDREPLDAMQRLALLRDPARLPGGAEAAVHQATADAVPVGLVKPLRVDAAQAASLKAPPVPGVSRSAVVGSGEGLSAVLARLFVVGSAAQEVTAAYASMRSPTKLQAGTRVWARYASTGVLDASTVSTLVFGVPGHDSGDNLTVERGTDGQFLARAGGVAGLEVRQALRCGVLGSLEESLRRCGEGEALAELVQAVLGERLLQPIDLRTGDELRLVVDKVMDGEQVVQYERVAAVEVRRVAEPVQTVLAFAGSYYSAQGTSLEPLFMRLPLRSGRQTSKFGMRLHPILHRMKAHLGVDYGAARGTPVYAAAAGTLTTAGRSGGGGNVVRVRHDDGYATEYMHLQKFAGGLKVGQLLAKGQLIGYVGSTGLSTGPHLHFGAKRRGHYIDPLQLADVPMPPLDAAKRKSFEAERQVLLDLLAALGQQGDRS